jgi:hypothetical protein
VSPVALNPDWNNIAVYALYDQFSLFINDQYVADFSDSRLPEGNISLAISVHDTAPGQIWSDDFFLKKE